MSARFFFLILVALFFGSGARKAPAQTIPYTNGENDSSPIVIASTATLTLSSGTATQSGAISSSGSPGQLDVNINGTIILTGSNTYTGGTMIGATGGGSATLQIGNGGTTGSIVGNVGNDDQIINLGGPNNTTLAFDRSDTVTYGGQISGLVNLTQMGSGTLIFTGTMGASTGFPFVTPTPTNTIASGTLQIGNGGTSGNLTGNVTDNSVLIFDRSDTITYGSGGSAPGSGLGSGFGSSTNTITGTGSVIKQGTGTLVLGGYNSYSGGTLISAGAIEAQGTLGTGTIVDNASLLADGGTIANNITGTGSLTQNSGFPTTLTGTNSYSGGTAITNGQLEFAATTAMSASGTVTVGSTGTLAVMVGTGTGLFSNGTSGNGTIGGLLSGLGGQSGSTVAWNAGAVLGLDTTNATGSVTYGTIADSSAGARGIAKLGTGTLVLTGNNTYTGATSVQGGLLVLTGNNAYAGGTTVSGSATLLQVSADHNLGAASGSVTLSGGGELLTTGSDFTTNRAITITDAGTLAAAAGTTATYNGAITASQLNIGDGTNTGSIVLTGSIASIQFLAINSATLEVSADGDPNSTLGTVTLSGGGELLTNAAAGFVTGRSVHVDGAGTLAAVSGTTATYTAATFGGGTLTIGDGLNSGTITFASAVTVYSGNGNAPSVNVDSGATLDNAGAINGSEGFNLSSTSTYTDATGGAGVEVQTGGHLIAETASTITGGTGGDGDGVAAGNGGAGLVLDSGASAINSGIIKGGQFGIGYDGGSDGNGGNGVTLGANASFTNNGTIAGGSGGSGSSVAGTGVAVGNGASLTNSSTGTITGGSSGLLAETSGVGVTLADSATLTNSGVIYGGPGPTIYYGSAYGQGGDGVIAGADAVVINSGTITAGSGEVNGVGFTGVALDANASLTNQAGGFISGGLGREDSAEGNGGTGVTVAAGATLNNAGTITGGQGGDYGYSGGSAVALVAGAGFTNTGTLTGGTGGNAAYQSADVVTGGSGVSADVNVIFANAGTIVGGTGGNGGVVNYGAGGAGVSLSAGDIFTNNGTITGGTGGNTGENVGGNGGAGVNTGSGGALYNTGTITGGTPGSAYAPDNSYVPIGNGGQGVIATGNSLIVNAGHIAPGLSFGAGFPVVDAIDFSGGGNTLELYSTSQITGSVVSSSGTANGGDTLALGGAANGTFDVSTIGDAAQYQGFANFLKTDSGTWTLTNTTTAVTPWTLSHGTLAVSSDGALGDDSGTLTLDGGTLQTTASFSSTRSVAITSNGGTINTYGTSLALGGTVSGPGGLTYNDSKGTGTLTLTAANTYAGGTNVRAGTLLLGNGTNGSATGSGALTVAAGAAIGGAGTSNSTAFTINGTVIAGNGSDAASQLTLTATGASTISGANLVFNLGTGAQQGQGNVLNLGATPVTFSNTTLQFNLLGGSVIAADTAYTLITFSSPVDATADGLTLGANGQIIGGLTIADTALFGSSLNGYTTGFYNGSYLFINGDSIDLEVVPEPSTWALLAAALLVLARWRRNIRHPAKKPSR